MIKRFLAGGVVLSVLCVSVQLIGARSAVAAELSPANSSGHPGSTLEVTGSSYAPLLTVELCWNQSGCDDLGTTTANLLGGFTTTVTIPTTADPGVYDLYACQLLEDLTCSSAPIEVMGEATNPSTTTTTAPTTTQASVITTTTASTATTTGGPPTTTTGESTTPTTPGTTATPPSDTGAPPTEASPTALGGIETLAVTTATSDEVASDRVEASPPWSYTPPTVPSTSSPTPDEVVERVEDTPAPSAGSLVVEAAGPEEEDHWSLDSPFELWTAWLMTVVSAMLLASGVSRLLGRRRGHHS
ncbi:MAG TPA: hypothetical protein VMQ46_02575 [Acidimicrobiia bacterium]|nr:hypothetical protein [Acidimicrobiia bacterium]